MFGWILVASVGVLIILILKEIFWDGKTKDLNGRHVVVTGGSSGIGLSSAKEVVKRGASVTIIARDVKKLENAREEIRKACVNKETQNVNFISADVTVAESINDALLKAESDHGSIYMLINCAGMAICGKFEDMSVSDIKHLTDLNLLGTIYPTHAIVKRMKSRREGIIVITSSQAGLVGLFGYSAYSSTKFALRGLAEALHMETKPYNVSVTLALPPDTDTPGFANEEKSKPIETKLISGSAGLTSPDEVAAKLVKDALRGRFYSYVGLESFVLSTLCAGMCPLTSLSELVVQSFLMGHLRVIGVVYLISFYKIIAKYAERKDDKKSK